MKCWEENHCKTWKKLRWTLTKLMAYFFRIILFFFPKMFCFEVMCLATKLIFIKFSPQWLLASFLLKLISWRMSYSFDFGVYFVCLMDKTISNEKRGLEFGLCLKRDQSKFYHFHKPSKSSRSACLFVKQ